MLPSMQTTTNNRCPMETERDVAHVEYDVINYYTDANVNPETIVSETPQHRCSRVNNHNSSTLLDVVVHSRSARERQKSLCRQEDASIAPAPTSSSSSSLSATERTKGGGIGSSRQRSKETSTPTLGVNMRVTGQCSQGGRKYMEDQFSVAYQESPLTHELEYAFFGIYDGHGGTEAALFAKEHLMLEIVKQKLFWSDNDEDVLRAIREGYISTHFAMWREQDKWPRTANGHLSTAGTTATVAFMRREKIYIGHVGDSGIVLGCQNPNERRWRAKQLTVDHKPESLAERTRIQRSGGQVAIKSGVPRVVWNRPRDPMHRGPIKRRTLVDDIPFLAVARSLGDLWSYNSRCKEFVVSPDPDVKVVKIDPNTFRCLIFGTDGLWNVVTPQEAVDSVRERHIIGECLHEQEVMNPSKALVDKALKTWATKKMRADNTSVVTVILTPATGAATTAAAKTDMLELEPLDTENKYPAADMDSEDLDMELCGIIEETEYLLDTPYSALAKRHLPPEAYRNFDYYIEEDMDTDELEQEQEQDEQDQDIENDVLQQSKYWRKSLNQSVASWQQTPTLRNRHHETENTEPDTEIDVESEPAHDLYSSNISELEQHLEHSFESYTSGGAVNTTAEYSFAESYNSLLNEQQAVRNQQQQQQQLQHTQQLQLQQQHAHSQQQQMEQQQQQQMRSMQDILQEQQRYQQQEGYSLTQLETRREQQQQQQQEQQVPDGSNRWTAATYADQPTELLALNALLQQERDEEQQVALERELQQQQQFSLVEASSSCSASCSSSSSCHNESEYADAPPWSDNVATLQDNEVSSTLPATPTPPTSSELGLDPTSSPPASPTPSTQMHVQQQLPQQQQQQQQQQPVQAEPKIMRQVRRYRNVPNENHQHMQTRRRQLFKHTKGKSFIATSAAAIVAFGSEALPGSSSNGSGGSSNNSTSSGASSSRRRRSVNSSASNVMMTRRSHSLSLASGGNVSKRQLRSSICQLDLTKHTLRTRNVTPALNSSSSSNSITNTTRCSGGKNSNTNIDSHTFNKPATPPPAAATTAASSGSARRLRRCCNEQREQRRSLRRHTLSANQMVGSSSGSSVSPFSKPTRLQSCSGSISARPPPSPKKLNAVVPTLAIGTPALAAPADLSKRWSLRSSSSSINNNNNNNNSMTALVTTAISCYSVRSRTSSTTSTSRRR